VIDEAKPMLDETLKLARATKRMLRAMHAPQEGLYPTDAEVEALENLERVLVEHRKSPWAAALKEET
jgi:hypothetical protein